MEQENYNNGDVAVSTFSNFKEELYYTLDNNKTLRKTFKSAIWLDIIIFTLLAMAILAPVPK